MHPILALFRNERRPSGPMPDAPPARRAYGIVFTPRSGSTLLTELCRRTQVLGVPGEYFRPASMLNPANGRGNFAVVPSDSIESYAQGIRRKFKSRADVFGFQVTPHQIGPLLESGDWWRLFPDVPYCTLTRRDLVAQAVSLHLMTVSGVAHSSASADVGERRDAVAYDEARIYRWLRHVLTAEWLIERHFAPLRPLRLVYEDFIADKAGTLEAIARHVGVALEAPVVVDDTANRRLADARSQAWCARFRADNESLLTYLTSYRGRASIHDLEAGWRGDIGHLLDKPS